MGKTGGGRGGGSVSDVEGDSITNRMCQIQEARSSGPSGPSVNGSQIPRQQHPPEPPVRSSSAASGSVAYQQYPAIDGAQAAEIVGELQRQLLEKESLLTETRLEALSSAHQVSLNFAPAVEIRGRENSRLLQDCEPLKFIVST